MELKALPRILPLHVSQVVSYLKALRLPLGLLLNFGESQLRTGIRRVVHGGSCGPTTPDEL